MGVFLVDTNMTELDFVMCHNCHYTKTKYHAVRRNISGEKEIYRCLKCGSFTTPDDGFWKMKHS